MAGVPDIVVRIVPRLTSSWRALIPFVDEEMAAWIDEHAEPEPGRGADA